MYYETDKNDHGLRYNPLKACVVPRPIGWITTISAAGVVNLAPFSFFNVLSYDPPFVLFSAGAHEARRRQEGLGRQRRGDRRVRLQHGDVGAERSDEPDRADRRSRRRRDAAAGLEALPSRLVRPPRVKGSPVQFECRLHQVVKLPGRSPSSDHHVVIGRVVAVHIDDAVLTADGRVDVLKLRPIARLGYKDYTSVDSLFQMEKPMPEDHRR